MAKFKVFVTNTEVFEINLEADDKDAAQEAGEEWFVNADQGELSKHFSHNDGREFDVEETD